MSKNACFLCEATSNERVLVSIEQTGDPKYVCVGCLPGIIHGR